MIDPNGTSVPEQAHAVTARDVIVCGSRSATQPIPGWLAAEQQGAEHAAAQIAGRMRAALGDDVARLRASFSWADREWLGTEQAIACIAERTRAAVAAVTWPPPPQAPATQSIVTDPPVLDVSVQANARVARTPKRAAVLGGIVLLIALWATHPEPWPLWMALICVLAGYAWHRRVRRGSFSP